MFLSINYHLITTSCSLNQKDPSCSTLRIGHGSADAWNMFEPICVTTLLRKHLFLTLKRFNPPEEVSYVFTGAFSTTQKNTTSNRKGPKEQNRGRRYQQEKGAAEERQEGTQSIDLDVHFHNMGWCLTCS